MKILITPLCLAVALASCDDNISTETYIPSYRQALPAATSAEEWSQRVKVDASEYSSEATHLYAELPQQDQWDKAFELAAPHFKKEDTAKFAIFKLLLDKQNSAAEAALKDYLKSAKISEYDKSEAIELLYTLSSNPEATQQWIQLEKPQLLERKKDDNDSSESPKKPWEIALADDEVEKGLQLLWESLAGQSTSDTIDTLDKIIQVSHLVGDSVNRDKAMAEIEKAIQKISEDDYVSPHNMSSWITLLAENQQWEKLSNFAKQQLDKADSFNKDSYQSLLLWSTAQTCTQAELEALLQAHQAEHQLNLNSLTSLLQTSYAKLPNLGILYSQALRKLDRSEDAWAVAAHMVASATSDDTSYQNALSLNPQKFAPLLNELRQFDAFEERPLIWQSKLALDAGDTELAKTLIDQAIALDPSDGDQGKNSRMQAYFVLARIYEAQGNAEKATFFDGVVKAIRSGEEADDYLYAGLITQAITRYQESLGHFNDAYCLQSRLALTLARNGRFEEAVPHFEKAFNLMPVSFGPRESHCFGCEGLFSDERVHGIAERILTAFVEKNPDNPRAPYLLGLVYSEMKKHDSAAAAFQKALEMDPQYYNAADRLLTTLKKDPKNAPKIQPLIQQSLRIAPYSDLAELFQERSDLAQAWVDAANYSTSPLNLGVLPIKPAVPTEQYGTQYSWGQKTGIDGWSREELLSDNQTLDNLFDL